MLSRQEYRFLPAFFSQAVNTPGPAPGYRDFTSGALGGYGSYGYSWSSSGNGTYCVFLDFYAQALNPSSVLSRGHGLQLRCLSE